MLKIGLTLKPYNTFANDAYVYAVTGYSGMVVMYVYEDSQLAAEMEAALIGLYRVWDRHGNRVGRPGDDRCRNRAPGCESAHHHHSPHFVYVVYGFAPQWHLHSAKAGVGKRAALARLRSRSRK